MWSKFKGDLANTGDGYTDRVSSEPNWKTNVGAAIYSSPVMSSSGDIFIGSSNKKLYCLLSTGEIKWSFSTNGIIAGSPAVTEAAVYIGSLDGNMYSLDLSGSLLWSFVTGSAIFASPAVFENNVIFGSQDSYVYSVNTNGTLYWKRKLAKSINSSPAISKNGIIYVYGSFLNAFTSSGSLIWKVSLEVTTPQVASPSINNNNGVVYFAATDKLNALNSQGTTLWSANRLGIGSPAIDSQGFLYSTYALGILKLNPSGSIVWDNRLDKPVTTGYSLTIGYDGQIFYGAEDYLYSFNGSTGSLNLNFQTFNSKPTSDSNITSSISQQLYSSTPMSIVSDGRIIIGSSDGNVYSFTVSAKSESPTSSPTLSTVSPTYLRPTFSPSFFPTQSPTSKKADKSNSQDIIIIAVTVSVFCVLLVVLSLIVWRICKMRLEKPVAAKVKEIDVSFDDENIYTPHSGRSEGLTHRSQHLNRHDSQNSFGSGQNSPSKLSSTYASSNGIENFKNMRRSGQLGPESSNIKWDEICIKASSPEEAMIGQGSFGTVIRGFLRHNNSLDLDVAIKVFSRSANKLSDDSDATLGEAKENAWREAMISVKAFKQAVNKECIIRVYGVVEGPMPYALTSLFRLQPGEEGVGIVMRYEAGGSLETLLHHRSSSHPLKNSDKVHLLRGVAEGVVELHTLGIIHADLKPGNVLLSHHNPPEVRLGDFGVALVREGKFESLGGSSLRATNNARGTPIYRAPEMLVNPLQQSFDETVARASRKTDMYSFGILAWEVLARKKPFHDFKTEVVLATKVHQGVRPPIDQLPQDTAPGLITMIESCWDANRQNRKTAVECLSILHHQNSALLNDKFDIFFSHAWSGKPFLSNVFHFLTRKGYRVWYDQFEMSHDMIKSMSLGIEKSQVMIVCGSTAYQNSTFCMFELQEASKMDPPKPIVTLITEPSPETWAQEEFSDLSGLKTNGFVDLSDIARHNWSSDEGPSSEMLQELTTKLEELILRLTEAGCKSTFA